MFLSIKTQFVQLKVVMAISTRTKEEKKHKCEAQKYWDA